jgi:uncharacterized phosphosugar-binding protein
LIFNALVCEVIQRLATQDGTDHLPVFASLNLAGAEAHNVALLEKYQQVNPHL